MKYIFKVFVILLFTSFRVSAQSPVTTIPDFTFFKLNKTPFTNKDLQPGKASFFVFFDSDCEHCQHAFLSLNKHYQEFKNTAFYLITLDNQEKVNHFMAKYAPNINGKKNVTLLQDIKNDFLTKFRPRKYPSMFLFSKKNNLVAYEDNEENIFRIIKQTNAL